MVLIVVKEEECLCDSLIDCVFGKEGIVRERVFELHVRSYGEHPCVPQPTLPLVVLEQGECTCLPVQCPDVVPERCPTHSVQWSRLCDAAQCIGVVTPLVIVVKVRQSLQHLDEVRKGWLRSHVDAFEVVADEVEEDVKLPHVVVINGACIEHIHPLLHSDHVLVDGSVCPLEGS